MIDESNQLSFLPPPRPRWWEQAVFTIPAIAALSLGALYAGGALVKAAQLQGAGLPIRETLPLLPLETILGAGIGILMQSLVSLLILVVFGVGSVFVAQRLLANLERWKKIMTARQQRREEKLEKDLERGHLDSVNAQLERERIRSSRQLRLLWGVLIVTVLSMIGTALLVNPVIFVTFFVTVVVAGALWWVVIKGHLPIRYLPYAAAGQYVLLLAAYVVVAFVYPTPLPKADVHLANGKAISGQLVVATGNTWYLTRKGHIIALPLATVERGKITPESEPRPASTGTRLLDLLGI